MFTGSRVPVGADAVVMQEHVVRSGSSISLQESPRGGACIRRKGEEVVAGDVVLEAGTLVSPPALGLLATLGITRFPVFEAPRVSVLGTGDDLVSPGLALEPGQVYESNTFAVNAALQAMGVSSVRVGRVADDFAATSESLALELAQSDVLIVCGGMSVGDHDHVRPAVAAVGVTERLWRVRVRPGKPFYFGVGPSGQLVFGLPGNPVSVLVTFLLFVRPALLQLLGRSSDCWSSMSAGEAMSGGVDRDDFARARVSEGQVWLDERQGSHMLTAMALADGLVRIPAGREIAAGEMVDFLPLCWWPT